MKIKNNHFKVVILLLFVLIVFSSCDGMSDISSDIDNGQKTQSIEASIIDYDLDPIEENSSVDLVGVVEGIDDNDIITFEWFADAGELNNENNREVTWTAPSSSGLYNIELLIETDDGRRAREEARIIVGEIDGLVFEHNLSLEGDATNRPKMKVRVRNIQEDVLELDVIGTIYGNEVDIAEYDEKLFDFIKYDTMDIINYEGGKLSFNKDLQVIDEKDGSVWYEPFQIDRISINTGDSKSIVIEYEMASNSEVWEGFGGSLNDFSYDGASNPGHFWKPFFEWVVLRPARQVPGVIKHNQMKIDLPSNFQYATVYPEVRENVIDLGELENMWWQNIVNWKRQQRAPFVLYNTETHTIESEYVAGNLVKDVFPSSYEGIRNHEANHQYIQFISDFVGEIPYDKILTFSITEVDGGAGSMTNPDAYARAPYGYGYSPMGRYFGSGADIGIDGRKRSEPAYWSFYEGSEPFDEYNHTHPMWGTARLWFGTIIKAHNLESSIGVYLSELAVASYYTDWDVYENRFKPMYEFYLEEVVESDGTEKSWEIEADTGHPFDRFKGGLAFYYFDERIQEETNGNKSLSDAMHIFYDEILSNGNVSDTNEKVIVDALYEVVPSGINFEEKVQKFIFGDIYVDEYDNLFLDLSDYLDVDLNDYDIPY